MSSFAIEELQMLFLHSSIKHHNNDDCRFPLLPAVCFPAVLVSFRKHWKASKYSQPSRGPLYTPSSNIAFENVSGLDRISIIISVFVLSFVLCIQLATGFILHCGHNGSSKHKKKTKTCRFNRTFLKYILFYRDLGWNGKRHPQMQLIHIVKLF